MCRFPWTKQNHKKGSLSASAHFRPSFLCRKSPNIYNPRPPPRLSSSPHSGRWWMENGFPYSLWFLRMDGNAIRTDQRTHSFPAIYERHLQWPVGCSRDSISRRHSDLFRQSRWSQKACPRSSPSTPKAWSLLPSWQMSFLHRLRRIPRFHSFERRFEDGSIQNPDDPRLARTSESEGHSVLPRLR